MGREVVGDRLLHLYSQIKDDYLRERGSDIEDVAQRLLVALSGAESQTHQLGRRSHCRSRFTSFGSSGA